MEDTQLLEFSRPPAAANLKEQLARKTLKNVRAQGHTYVDIREDGKRHVFFCTICMSKCYSDDTLFSHLGGNCHQQMLATAKSTLMSSPNPWPFDDGMFFFNNSLDEEEVEDCNNTTSLAIVVRGEGGEEREAREGGFDLVVPGVIGKEEVSDLRVRLTGSGQISARIFERDGKTVGMQRVWCEWLGKRQGNCDDDDDVCLSLPRHDFGVVTFKYYYDLGKQGLFDEIKTLLLTGGEESDGNNGRFSKRRKRPAVSDSEDGTSERLGESSGEESMGSSSSMSMSSALLLHRYDDQVLESRIIPDKSLRRELRKQKRVASKKVCDICRQKLLPGKDVATLLNLKTGRLACSSRNVHGAFHVFHTSCLIHWILLCESEMYMKPPERPKARRRPRKSVKPKLSQQGNGGDENGSGVKCAQPGKESDAGTFCDQICSVNCPDCQGTGVIVEGQELEKPSISLSAMFKYRIMVGDAHRAWMKGPEELENCSTGFAFSGQAEDAQETVVHMKLLPFYRADEDCWPESF